MGAKHFKILILNFKFRWSMAPGVKDTIRAWSHKYNETGRRNQRGPHVGGDGLKPWQGSIKEFEARPAVPK